MEERQRRQSHCCCCFTNTSYYHDTCIPVPKQNLSIKCQNFDKMYGINDRVCYSVEIWQMNLTCCCGEKHNVHPATGSTSAIDLCICSSDVFSRHAVENLCGNDHYPITIFYGTKETPPAIPRWKLRKSDWLSKRRKRALRKVKVHPSHQNIQHSKNIRA